MAFWGKTTQDRFKKSPNSHERSIRKRLTEGSRVSLLSSSTSLRKLNDNESMHSHYDSVDRKMSRRESSSSSSSEVFDIDDEISRAEKDIALKRKKLADARSRKEKFQLERDSLAVEADTRSASLLRLRASVTSSEKTVNALEKDIAEKQAILEAQGKKSKAMRAQLQEIRNDVAREKEQTRSLQLTVDKLKKATDGFRRGVQRQREALAEKRGIKTGLQGEQQALVRDNANLSVLLTDEADKLRKCSETIVRQHAKIDDARTRNKNMPSSVRATGAKKNMRQSIGGGTKEWSSPAFTNEATRPRYSNITSPVSIEDKPSASSGKLLALNMAKQTTVGKLLHSSPLQLPKAAQKDKLPRTKSKPRLILPADILTTSPPIETDQFDTNNAPFSPPRTPQEKKIIGTKGLEIFRQSHSWANDGPVISWKRGHQIGRGAFSKVYLGFNLETGAQIAVKELDMWHFGLNVPGGSREGGDPFDSESSDVSIVKSEKSLLLSARSNSKIQVLKDEIGVMRKLAHENIVRYLGCDLREVVEEESGPRLQMYILLEYVPGGSLQKMYQEWGAFNLQIVQEYSRQILRGLSYLHDRKIIHRDIKGANILINENGVVKLADFGCAQVFQGDDSLKGNSNSTMLGSIPWMAPEAIKHFSDHVGRKADIWSFGCTVIEMATARPPWPEMHNAVALMYKVAQNEESPTPPPSFDKQGVDFLRHCFHRNPNARWSSGHLLEHPFVALKGDVDFKPAASARD